MKKTRNTEIYLLSANSYGEVAFMVNGKTYVYQVDSAWLHYAQNKYKRQVGKFFNRVKKKGQLIEQDVED